VASRPEDTAENDYHCRVDSYHAITANNILVSTDKITPSHFSDDNKNLWVSCNIFSWRIFHIFLILLSPDGL
jgi:hypothetical protein